MLITFCFRVLRKINSGHFPEKSLFGSQETPKRILPVKTRHRKFFTIVVISWEERGRKKK